MQAILHTADGRREVLRPDGLDDLVDGKTSGLQRHYAMESMKMPLDDIDQADEGLFNRVLWHSVKGYDIPYPNLAHREMLGEEEEKED